ncbi:MAG TPA: HNH endonuclease signature motif containing protein [Jatrophihabitans sp.]|nr:HNH endonuclease signature motif containing protein [Jatrophihabitans sp.]
MIDATCKWCEQPYRARTVQQRFCSKRCAGLHQFRDHERKPHKWGRRVSVDREHRKLRARLLPAAIGTPCPLGVSPHCTGLMTDPSRMQLDHIVERANGGPTTEANCRIVCTPCNQRRGSQLGNRNARRARDPQRPPVPHKIPAPSPRKLPRW